MNVTFYNLFYFMEDQEILQVDNNYICVKCSHLSQTFENIMGKDEIAGNHNFLLS